VTTTGDHRLPRFAAPVRYDLVIEPDISSASFTGSAEIEIDIIDATDRLVLNAVDLEIDEATVTGSAVDAIRPAMTFDADAERVTFTVETALEPGRVTLHTRFRGVLNDQLRGFYRSTYENDQGEKVVIATTQLESTDARRVFPCFDEPDRKAVFGITLVVDERHTAISNARNVSSEPVGDGRRRVRFADTMKMSSYLVAFVVGDLDVTSAVMTKGGVPVRVVTRPGATHLADFALECAPFCLDFFTHYFDRAYPGDKLDLLAIPDFAAGAMENLGAVTFRENALLVDPAQATHSELKRVAEVIAHEVAHMWFGDLVTMSWWNGIWLNEAFATFMEILALDAWKPEWEVWTSEKLGRSHAYTIDSLTATRPIEFEVVHPADAEGMFDTLTYTKGGAVLRMLEQYLGPDAFRDGVRAYLDQHAYGSTETSDLWDALEETTGQPCRRIMDSWIYQGGFPLITLEPADSDQRLRVSQRRFRFAGASLDEVEPPQWSVPIMMRTLGQGARSEHRLVLDAEMAVIDVGAPIDAVVGNTGAEGFYRVGYSRDLRDAIAARLGELTTVERLALVNDSWAAVSAATMTGPEFMDLARRFTLERHPDVWSAVVGGLGALRRIVPPHADAEMATWIRTLLCDALARLGRQPRPDDSSDARRLRALLVREAADLGDDRDVASWAAKLLDEGDGLEPELASAAVMAVAVHGDADTHQRFWTAHRNATTPQEELRYLWALPALRDEALALITLRWCLDGSIRTQNGPFVVHRALANRYVAPVAWSFMVEHWDELNAAFPRNTIIYMVEPIASMTRPEQSSEIHAFFADHPIPQSATTLDQLLERNIVNMALRQREAARLAGALA